MLVGGGSALASARGFGRVALTRFEAQESIGLAVGLTAAAMQRTRPGEQGPEVEPLSETSQRPCTDGVFESRVGFVVPRGGDVKLLSGPRARVAPDGGQRQEGKGRREASLLRARGRL
jgi:hypothetical protein